jgi:hypothetical protein
MLANGGLSVERHDDHFGVRTPDAEWIQSVAERGWVAVTRDRRIRYKTNEREAVIENGLRLLVLSGVAPVSDLAENFVRTIAEIERLLDTHPGPWIAKVHRPAPAELQRNPVAHGRVERWYPKP